MQLTMGSAERRAAARPHVIRGLVGILIAAAGITINAVWTVRRDNDFTFDDKIGAIGALVFLIGGVIIVRAFGRAVHAAAADRLQGKTKGTPISFLINAFGYLIVALGVLGILKVQPGSLLFGGALTGVMLGIAAQQTLGNFFAGIVLMLVRPFSVSDRVYLKGALGEYEGDITDMTLFYVHITTERGAVMLPNAGVLASAVGPGARAEKTGEPEEEPTEEPKPGKQAPGPSEGGAPG
ncbi:MAG: mechanosensitive ion channel domain-containing protein [Actinomycetota bacterium]